MDKDTDREPTVLDLQPPNILVVDDEPVNLRLLKAVLVSSGYRILEARNGPDALEKAKDQPDLILLDVMMPEMDGFETCRRLKDREKTKGIPVIFLSALEDPKARAFGIDTGGVDYISKPFDAGELIARVKLHLTLRQQELQLKTYSTKLEQMVEERTQQLIHMERLATLGTFSAAIAHEINNPVTYILGNAEMLTLCWPSAKSLLEAHLDEDEIGQAAMLVDRFETMAEGIMEGTRRISRLVTTLKSYGKKGGDEKKEEPLKEIIEDSIDLVHHRLKKGFVTEVVVSPDLKISCDRQKISQVFVNLLNNAMDAMGGEEGNIVILADAGESEARIHFKDSGPGIPSELSREIFSPFCTTKGEAGGTGLGLFIVRGIIEDHGGKISLASSHEKGAQFDIMLPLPEAGAGVALP